MLVFPSKVILLSTVEKILIYNLYLLDNYEKLHPFSFHKILLQSTLKTTSVK